MNQTRRKTLQSRLIGVIVAAVLGAGFTTFAAFSWTTSTTEKERLSDIEQQIRETISSKAEALALSHAFALRGLVEDNAIGDVRELVGHAVGRDADVVYGLFVSPEGQAWAYAAPSHPNVQEEVASVESVLAELQLHQEVLAVPGLSRRSIRAFGQEVDEVRVRVAGEEGASLGNLVYGFGNERTRRAVAHAGERSQKALSRAFWMAGAAGLLSLLLAILWGLRSAKRLTAPVGVLTDKANAIASGQRGVRADIRSGDEIEVLAAAFNQMQAANEEALTKLEATTERALAADRMKSEFLANMSHEIRTPMNGVLGISKLMLSMPIDGKQRRYVDTIHASATALLTIINDVLDFSKIEAGKYTLAPTKFEFHAVVQDVVELLAGRAHDKGIDLVYRLEPQLPRFLIGDPDRFRQVLNNLLGNAIKFTEQGEVFVDVSIAGWEDAALILRVAVTDTGMGIAAADLPKLYHAFSQIDGSLARRHGGTGLGLAISKRLVEMMGGRLEVDSELGRGSTFGFTVRFQLDISEQAEEAPPKSSVAGRVLVVEPSRRAGEVLLEQLVAAGVAADRCETGAAALTRLRASTEYRFVVISSQVRDRSGPELAEAIRSERGETLPVMILASTRGGPSRESAGLFRWELLKPIRISELLDCLSDRDPGAARGSLLPAPEARARLSSRPVLVIDDNDVNRFVVVEHLEQRGYVTQEAVNGRDAFEKFKNNSYACLLMDCQMPVMDGYAATRAIRDFERQIGRGRTPIIALTAHALAGERERVLDAGMDDFLSKPFQPSILDSILRRCFETGPPPSATPLGHRAALAPPAQEARDLDPDAIRSAKLIRLFLDRTPELLASLGRAIEQGDAPQVRAFAHKIKGSALALTAERMSETAATMQHLAERNELSTLRAELQGLERQYSVVCGLLEVELEQAPAPPRANAS